MRTYWLSSDFYRMVECIVAMDLDDLRLIDYLRHGPLAPFLATMWPCYHVVTTKSFHGLPITVINFFARIRF